MNVNTVKSIYALSLLAFSISMFASQGGDLRLRQPPTPPVKVKLADIKASLLPMESSIERAIMQPDPANMGEAVSFYFRALGGIFCGMHTNGNFTPEYLEEALQKVPSPLVTDGYMLEVTRVILGLYKIAYRDRARAELPPVEWIVQIADLFCGTIDRGIQKTGREGLKK